MVLIWRRWRDLIAILLCRKYGVIPIETGMSRCPPNICILMGSNPQSIGFKQKTTPLGGFCLAEMEGFDCHSALQNVWSHFRQAENEQSSTGTLHSNGFKSPIDVKNPNTPKGVFGFLAEMEGFEPPHALRRLADFESAPFSHLGTSPKTLVL